MQQITALSGGGRRGWKVFVSTPEGAYSIMYIIENWVPRNGTKFKLDKNYFFKSHSNTDKTFYINH